MHGKANCFKFIGHYLRTITKRTAASIDNSHKNNALRLLHTCINICRIAFCCMPTIKYFVKQVVIVFINATRNI